MDITKLSEGFMDAVRGYMDTRLDGSLGRDIPLDELSFELFDNDTKDGGLAETHSWDEAMDFMAHFRADAALVFDWLVALGRTPVNPFKSPEGFQLAMVIEGAAAMIDTSDLLYDSRSSVGSNITLDEATVLLLKHDIGISTGLTDDKYWDLRELHADDPAKAAESAKAFLSGGQEWGSLSSADGQPSLGDKAREAEAGSDHGHADGRGQNRPGR